MNQLLCLAGPSLCALLLGAAVPAADLFVDANGTPGTYATVQAAILAAQPGDRILVLPGSYPAFSITKAIHIVGVGTEPSSVVVGGVHLGLGFPNQNYHVSLSRLRIDAGPTSPTAVSGQELGVGRIEFDSVEVEGGFRLLPHGVHQLVEGHAALVATGSEVLQGRPVVGAGVELDLAGTEIDLTE